MASVFFCFGHFAPTGFCSHWLLILQRVISIAVFDLLSPVSFFGSASVFCFLRLDLWAGTAPRSVVIDVLALFPWLLVSLRSAASFSCSSVANRSSISFIRLLMSSSMLTGVCVIRSTSCNSFVYSFSPNLSIPVARTAHCCALLLRASHPSVEYVHEYTLGVTLFRNSGGGSFFALSFASCSAFPATSSMAIRRLGLASLIDLALKTFANGRVKFGC